MSGQHLLDMSDLKAILISRLAISENITEDMAAIAYTSLTQEQKFQMVSFHKDSPDMQCMSYSICGTLSCQVLPSFSLISDSDLQSIFFKLNNYFRIISPNIEPILTTTCLPDRTSRDKQPDTQTMAVGSVPTDEAAIDKRIEIMQNTSTTTMSDSDWWAWFVGACSDNLYPHIIVSAGSRTTDNHLIQLLCGFKKYMKDGTGTTVPTSYIISEVRKNLQKPSSSLDDFATLLSTCKHYDINFLTTCGLDTTFNVIYQNAPALEYFKFKANFGFTGFKSHIIATLDTIQGTPPKPPIQQLQDYFRGVNDKDRWVWKSWMMFFSSVTPDRKQLHGLLCNSGCKEHNTDMLAITSMKNDLQTNKAYDVLLQTTTIAKCLLVICITLMIVVFPGRVPGSGLANPVRLGMILFACLALLGVYVYVNTYFKPLIY